MVTAQSCKHLPLPSILLATPDLSVRVRSLYSILNRWGLSSSCCALLSRGVTDVQYTVLFLTICLYNFTRCTRCFAETMNLVLNLHAGAMFLFKPVPNLPPKCPPFCFGEKLGFPANSPWDSVLIRILVTCVQMTFYIANFMREQLY